MELGFSNAAVGGGVNVLEDLPTKARHYILTA